MPNLSEEQIQFIRSRRLMDDEFFSLALDGQCECCEEILRPILGKPDLKVIRVRTQKYLANLAGHAVQLDILAEDSDGTRYDIEIHNSHAHVDPHRGRYYHSEIDQLLLSKGARYENLPEVYVIFITDSDMFGKGAGVYHVDKVVRETGKRYDDGQHVLFANLKYASDNALGRLMADLKCTDPDQMHNPYLAERMRYLKETPEGVAVVSDAMQKLIDAGRKELREELKRKDLVIEQKDQALEQKDQALEQKDQVIEQKDQALGQTKQELGQARQELGEKDLKIQRLEQLLAANGLSLASD